MKNLQNHRNVEITQLDPGIKSPLLRGDLGVCAFIFLIFYFCLYALNPNWFSDCNNCHIEGVFFATACPTLLGNISTANSIEILHYDKKHFTPICFSIGASFRMTNFGFLFSENQFSFSIIPSMFIFLLFLLKIVIIILSLIKNVIMNIYNSLIMLAGLVFVLNKNYNF